MGKRKPSPATISVGDAVEMVRKTAYASKPITAGKKLARQKIRDARKAGKLPGATTESLLPVRDFLLWGVREWPEAKDENGRVTRDSFPKSHGFAAPSGEFSGAVVLEPYTAAGVMVSIPKDRRELEAAYLERVRETCRLADLVQQRDKEIAELQAIVNERAQRSQAGRAFAEKGWKERRKRQK